MRSARLLAALSFSVSTLLFTSASFAVTDHLQPEVASHTTITPRAVVQGSRFMISAANPLAVEAGAKILANGGNALDAAIATQMVLNVVEPQSSGIGGGGFLMYYDAKTGNLTMYDGRETAPALAHEKLFLDEKGNPLPILDAIAGGRSVGTPGMLKMLEDAHKEHGNIKWETLFYDAIRLSEGGFPMSPRLYESLKEFPNFKEFRSSFTVYLNDKGKWLKPGEKVVNKPLSRTLALIAKQGSAPFYKGEIARAIVRAVQKSPVEPGLLSLQDMEEYRSIKRIPVCAPYRKYMVCSAPPPSSGGVALLQALQIIEKNAAIDIRQVEPLSADAVHLFTEASRLAYADRNRYLADPAFADVPVKGLLDNDYLEKRAALIRADKVMKTAEAGQPPHSAPLPKVAALTVEEAPSTTHVSIVDAEGNVVSMTTSIEHGFGSGLSVGGFMLNNQLTDFTFTPTFEDGKTPHPNRVEPKKRPRSSMSPTIIFDEKGNPFMVIGSPGGARIIEYVLQTIIGVIDWNMNIQQAIEMPRYLNMNGPTELESRTDAAKLKGELQSRGHKVNVVDIPSGLHGITRVDKTLNGGADPRREGVAIGQ